MRNVKKEEPKNNKGSKVIIGVLFAIIFILIGFISSTQREVIETWPVIGQIFAEPEPVTVEIPLEEFIINSKDDTGTNRLVALELSLASDHADAEEKLATHLSQIRESVIYVVSSETTDTLLERESDAFVLSNNLKARINSTIDDELVDNVYILNIVIQ